MPVDFVLRYATDNILLALQWCALAGVLSLAYLGYTARDTDTDAMQAPRRRRASPAPPRRSPRIARRRAAE